MKRFVTILISLLAIISIQANPVDSKTAKDIATNFWAHNNTEMPNVNLEEVSLQFDNMYVFSTRDNIGFVIVSADNRVLPIIGYSFSNPVRNDSLPANLKAWLTGTGKQIQWMIDNNIEPSHQVTSEWKKLSTPLQSNAPAIITVVSPLLSTSWDQSPYYNDLCPNDGGYKSVTGCTATATAQVMKYWNHPATGHGSHSYSWRGQTLSANFGNTTYQWSNMPDELDYYSTSTEVNAVATLMYHVGVACEMDYSASGSGAQTISFGYPTMVCAENALRDYFHYDWGLSSVEYNNFSDAEWKQLLKNELDQSRPIIYTGYDYNSGHCFVCDGYNSSNQFDFNWGWGGYYDGFYSIGSLNPGSGTGGSSSGTYNIDNAAIINLKPNNSTATTSTISYSVNNSNYGSILVQGNTTMNNYSNNPTYLIAKSNEGYRFTDWSDGCIYNPRGFVGNGGNLSLTANFEPCGGDTLYYCKDGYSASFGTGSTSDTQWWGIRFPASQLQPNKTLKKVMLYITDAGSYTLHVYQGGTTSPQTSVHTQTVNLSGSGWKTISLSSTLSIDATQSLWIVFSRSGSSYPVAVTTYAGNTDTELFGNANGTSWSTLSSDGYYYSCMIKAIVDTRSGTFYTLTGNVTPSAAGYVEGTGEYSQGETASIFAKANTGYKFAGWEDGSMDQPREITMNSDKTVTASFVSLKADTLTYSVTDEYINSIGTSSSYEIYWAVRFDKSVLRKGQKITAIQLYDVSSSNTSMYIYKGGLTAPQTCEKSYSGVTTTARNAYNTYSLPTPYVIDETQPLWIVFKNDDSSSYPCAYTHYSGNNDGCFISVGGNSSWESLTESDFYVSWMIKVITTMDEGTGVEELVCYSNNVYTSGLDINVVTEKENAEIRICDLSGRVIVSQQQESTTGRYEMPLPGIYFVTIDGVQTIKVTVK